MVSRQLQAGGITDERVLRAMGSVPREEFVPERLRDQAYADGALPIGYGQTISQPWVVAAICQALELRGGERVLDVGGGAGYSTAVIAELVRPGGSVRSYELVGALADRARETLARLDYAEAEVLAGDGASARDESWDAIAVHAVAPELPAPLVKSLRPGGRLVLPIARGRADVLTAFTRTDDGVSGDVTLERTEVAECRFVPLLGESGFPSRDR
jgi:protein-L-isoaspartate(D-aspartate) O-methyltransferase